MHLFAATRQAPALWRRGLLFTIAVLISTMALTACNKDETTPPTPGTADSSRSDVTAPDPPDVDPEAGPRMAATIADFIRGYMLADPQLLAATLSAPNAARISEVAPALEMSGPIGEFVSMSENADGLLIETREEGATTFMLVPQMSADGLTLVVTSWQGTATERVAEQESVYGFVTEDGEYRIDTIDGRPASERMVQ